MGHPLLMLLARRQNPQAYTNEIKTIAPANLLAYWPLSDPVGSTVAADASGNGRDGTPTNVTFGAPGIGDGRSSGGFNGTDSNVAGFAAALALAFNTSAGTAALWIKVSGAGVWTDATIRRALIIGVNSSNRVAISKNNTSNQVTLAYTAGGTVKQVVPTGMTTVDWFHLALTWDKVADQVKAYLNGAQFGATLTGLGVWAGTIVEGQCFISGAAGNVSSGWLAHAALWNTALSAAQIATLATA